LASHRSAIKRNRQNQKKRLLNQVRRTRIKSLTKEVLSAVEQGNREEAQGALSRAVPAIQKAAARGTIHKNTAFRKISRLSRRVYAIPSAE
jgi:small subunit ribosomal protein S20